MPPRGPRLPGWNRRHGARFFALLSLLSFTALSFAVPATGGSFLLETALARVVLKEDIRWERWAGAVVVACGVGLLALP